MKKRNDSVLYILPTFLHGLQSPIGPTTRHKLGVVCQSATVPVVGGPFTPDRALFATPVPRVAPRLRLPLR